MTGPVVRRARTEEAAVIAEVWLSSRRAAEIPATAHGDGEVRDWGTDELLPSCEVWVVEDARVPVAVMALRDAWVEQLYVAPGHQRQGHGTRLIDVAKRSRSWLALWTFERNVDAQRFYETNGFVRSGPVSADNEEDAPAVCYRWWRGENPAQ